MAYSKSVKIIASMVSALERADYTEVEKLLNSGHYSNAMLFNQKWGSSHTTLSFCFLHMNWIRYDTTSSNSAITKKWNEYKALVKLILSFISKSGQIVDTFSIKRAYEWVGDQEILNWIHEINGYQDKPAYLVWSASYGLCKEVSRLVNKFDVNYQLTPNDGECLSAETALLALCHCTQDISSVKYIFNKLIERGVDINAKNEDGDTALMLLSRESYSI